VKEKGRLTIKVPANREAMMYQCSLCGHGFQLAEDRSARKAMTELIAAFKDHMRERHQEECADTEETK
jgi:N-acetyl-anhydromuramyl-L-alanine amidase AmpD